MFECVHYLRPFVNHIKSKLKKAEKDRQKAENPPAAAPSKVKAEPKSGGRRVKK